MKKAFTLAEVLITLGIIGVVAAMTIPTLIQDYNQRSWNTSASVFNRKLGEALKVMNTQSALGGYSTTMAFVEELSRHMKINKICTEVTDCFPSQIYVDGEVVEVSDIKKSDNLYKESDYGTEVVGVMFANGVNAILAYNPQCVNDPYNNNIVAISGNKNNVSLGTDAISILYDVSGFSAPNEYTNTKDVRGINVSLNLLSCITKYEGKCIVGTGGAGYASVDCSAAAVDTEDYQKYCGNYPSGSATDYWAGARKYCDVQGLRVTTYAELRSLHTQIRGTDITLPWASWYWIDDPNPNCSNNFTLGKEVSFDGYYSTGCYNKAGTTAGVICIE